MSWDSKKGDWVQISRVILEPKERASQLPEDTKKVPLTILVKGFLSSDANVGDTVTVTTILGRQMSGELVVLNPGYTHSFGPPPEGFIKLGKKFKELLDYGG